MAPNDQAQKNLQLAEITRQLAEVKITPDMTSVPFKRFVALVAGQLCEHSNKNGHMIPGAAAKCGLTMAQDELATIPEAIDMDARLAAVAVSILPKERHLGVKA